MLVPAIPSTTIPFSSSARRTPMWAMPRAPPPLQGRAKRGRAGGAGGGACASATQGARRRETKQMERALKTPPIMARGPDRRNRSSPPRPPPLRNVGPSDGGSGRPGPRGESTRSQRVSLGPRLRGFSLRTSRHGAAWRAGVGLALIGTGVATQGAASRHPAAVESLYSRALYPRLAGVLGCLTGWLPFSLG